MTVEITTTGDVHRMTLHRGPYIPCTTSDSRECLDNALYALCADGQGSLLMAEEATGDDREDMALAAETLREAGINCVLTLAD